METYNTRMQHSISYYHRILLALIEGITQNLPDASIAALINDRGLKTPTGKNWTAPGVRDALFKLRNHQTYRSNLHRALLQLAFDGLLKISDALILFGNRTSRQGMQ